MKLFSKNYFIPFIFVFFTIVFISPALLLAVNFSIDLEKLEKAENVVLLAEKDIPHGLWVAGQYLKQGAFNDVVIICEKTIHVQKNNIDAHAMLAAAYKGLRKEDKFIKESGYIKTNAPDSALFYLYTAQAYISLSDLEKAEDLYKKGLKNVPEKAKLHMRLAELYLMTERLKDASTEYESILKEEKIDEESFLNASFALCRIGLRNKDYDKVIKLAETVIKLYPVLPQGYIYTGNAYLAKNETEKAVKVYENLMKADPRSPVPYQELAIIYAEVSGDIKKGIKYAEEGAGKFTGDAKSQDVLGWIYYKNGEYDRSLKQFQTAARLAENDPNYHYHLGLAYQKMKEKEKALEAFEKASVLMPPDGAKELSFELRKKIKECR